MESKFNANSLQRVNDTLAEQVEGVDPLLFLCYDMKKSFIMDRSKLKDIVRSLELMVDTLKAEVYSDVDSYKNEKNYTSTPLDYDEMFDDGSD